MEELRLAQGILDMALAKAAEFGLSNIETIHIKKGEYNEDSNDLFLLAFKSLSKETLAQNAIINIDVHKSASFCKDCIEYYPTTDNGRICPLCASKNTKLVSGYEFYLSQVKGN